MFRTTRVRSAPAAPPCTAPLASARVKKGGETTLQNELTDHCIDTCTINDHRKKPVGFAGRVSRPERRSPEPGAREAAAVEPGTLLPGGDPPTAPTP
ncbi:hypothetical protein [Streptomyces sp. MMG1533]|uniref:hypothetical protein n=1 Tax=Streptomyces sp. MMG1533 TaxID=1415546 RepID=UPI000A6B84A2|nr:hypothetical protein [Streptomyces sp. MMG1533]